MARIRWTVGAQADLQEIVEYIAADSPVYAAVFAAKALGSVGKLQRFPKRGRVVPEFEDVSLREILVGNYRIVYRLRSGRIGVVAVAHGSRDLLRHVGNEPWDFG